LALTIFNLFASGAAAGAAMRLVETRADWASTRLHAIALILAFGMAFIGLAASWAAWTLSIHDPAYTLIILAPLGWLFVMGGAFAAVDFAEDGVLDFGRGPKR
jgi:hypothetical protein